MSRTITVNALIDALRRAKLLIRVNGGAYSEDITGITYNSNDVEAGHLFVCKGAHFREEYLKAALAAGASCYVSEELYGYGTLICPEIIVSDIRAAMSVIAQTYYGILSDSLRVIGITGTKGKSTTTYFVRSILDESMAAVGGHRTAICSGIENYDGVIEEESHLTTPEIMELYQHMNNAVNSGIRYLTMEVSSQALKYGRVEGVTFEAGAFLNIGTDHISDVEHSDFNDYLESKLSIFSQCRKAAINLDCDEQERIRAASEACPYVIAFSQKDETANIYGYDIKSDNGRISMKVRGTDIEGWNDFDEEFTLGTFGTINVENALAAIAISTLLGVPREYIHTGLAKALSPGRMEVFVSGDGKRTAIVDYAHNRNRRAAAYVMPLYTSIFPSLNPRKVPAFAEACVYSIITEDDCGEEDVNAICEEIAGFVRAAGGEYEILTDRMKAIRKAITLMDDDTILFIPGKGRETRLKRGTQYIDAPSDVDVVQKYL